MYFNSGGYIWVGIKVVRLSYEVFILLVCMVLYKILMGPAGCMGFL